ncbi:MAG: site-specific integrase [Syntrophomonas sp.]
MGFFRKYKTVEEILPDFLAEKEMTIQHRSFYPYMRATNVFMHWLKYNQLEQKSIKSITSDNISDFFLYLGKTKNLDKPTCEKYFLVLRQLFQYAEKRDELYFIPFDRVSFPKKKKDQGAEAIQSDDLKILIPYIKERDPQLFLACMIEYYCFIRPGKELRLLKVGDINLKDGLITVRQENAKNKTKQIVTMPQQLIDICYEIGINEADKNLFVFGKHRMFNSRPWSVNMLAYRFNKCRDALKLSKGYKLYSFKHTGATMLHMSGLPMRELMDQLRHTKLEATQHYLKKFCGIVNDRIRYNFPSPV